VLLPNEQRLRALFANALDAILIVNDDREYVDANPAACELLGVSRNIQHSSDIITVVDADGTVRYESPTVERVLGYRPEEQVGKHAFDFVHPEDLEQIRKTFIEALAKPGPTQRAEVRCRHADGSWRYLEAHGNNLLEDPATRGS